MRQMQGMNFFRQARQFETCAFRRWGGFYNEYDGTRVACVPTDYAAEVVGHWQSHVDNLLRTGDARIRSDMQQRAQNALDGLKRWASCPGDCLSPWAAERFWQAQEELAEALTEIWSWVLRPQRRGPVQPRRNDWLATPGQILAEMKTTKDVIEDLSHAIYDRYRRPYLDAHEEAFEEFKREHGRHADDDSREDMADILERIADKTGFRTTRENMRTKTYEPAFVKSWDRFYMEWDNWFAGNKNWTARMWGGAWEKAIEYRKRANQWRDKFEQLDPARNKVASPKPPVPADPWEEFGNDIRKWFKWGAVAVAGLVVLPPVISALRRSE